MEKKQEILLKTIGGEITHMFEVPVRFFKTIIGEHVDAYRVKREEFKISYVLQDTPTNLRAVELNILPFVEYYIYSVDTNSVKDISWTTTSEWAERFTTHDNYKQEGTGYPRFYFVRFDMSYTLNTTKEGYNDFMNSSVTGGHDRDGENYYIIYFQVIPEQEGPPIMK